MAITISQSDVKRKAMIADATTTYDTVISALITEMQGPLEYSIADSYLSAISDTKLQATLKLGILEIITGEFLEQLRREVGGSEQFTVAGLSVGESTLRGLDLVQQGATRLAPYLKGALPMISDSVVSSSTADSESVFSREEEVW